MKKLSNTVSPFLLLLLPMFFVVGLLVFNLQNDIPAERYEASIHLQIPSFKALIQSIF
ncbi:MAG: hypothetical protein ABI390_10195 [Daejeonella sp.]